MNLSKQSLLLIILIAACCIAYVIYFSDNYVDNQSMYVPRIVNKDETSSIIRKKQNRKYSKSKRIYISPKTNKVSIKSIKNQLKQKLKSIKSDTKPTIKLYFAEWCDHCIQFKPVWDQLKNVFSDRINFVDVNCTNNSPQLDYVTGFPTIALFDRNNKYLENYNDDRSKYGFSNFLNQFADK